MQPLKCEADFGMLHVEKMLILRYLQKYYSEISIKNCQKKLKKVSYFEKNGSKILRQFAKKMVCGF